MARDGRGDSRHAAIGLAAAWLEAWSEYVDMPVQLASARYDASAQLKQRLFTCAALLHRQAAQLGLSALIAPLDLPGWQRVACDARSLAGGDTSHRARVSFASTDSRFGQYP